MKLLLFGLFVIGGWTVIVGVVGYACAFGLIFAGFLPHWTWASLVYMTPALGFVIGVLHFSAIIRSA